MQFKELLIRYFYSCDGVKGLWQNPEDFLIPAQHYLLTKLGKKLSYKKKKVRLELLKQANSNRTDPLCISVIMPVYNSIETIQSAIVSIQKQSYQYWELLIVDDGSKDDLIKSLSTKIKQDNRIKIYSIQKNMGVSFARNVGLHFAKGEYITFHDADDVSHSERLEYQLSSLLKNPESSVVIFQTLRVDPKGKLLIINGRKKWNRVSGMMFPKSVMSRVGFYKPLKISEDSEYYERILATYGKSSRCILCKTLYYALFSDNSLLFSNATVNVTSNSVDYKINETESIELEKMRDEHKLISLGKLSPYQEFDFNNEHIKQVL